MRKRKISIVLMSTFFLCCSFTLSFTVSEGGKEGDTQLTMGPDSSWLYQPQVYTMVAFPPEDVNEYRITVNGLWNGFMGGNLNSPFAFGRYLESLYSGKEFTSDKDFVDYQHDLGLLVPGTILTTQGHASFQGDDLEEFACRSPDGQKIPWDIDAESYWMNAANPEFIDWCINQGKRAIDAGADMIVLDEIQGNSLAPMFQWAASYLGIPAPGFSNHTIEGFRQYLQAMFSTSELANLFGISYIDTYDLRTRIAETMHLTYEERITQDPLIEHYINFLDVNNYQAKKRLIQELRTYAAEKEQDIVISANSYALGTNRPGGYWPKGLQFSDLLDCYTFENKYYIIDDTPLPEFPRNKWLAWQKLAQAATGAPSVTLIDTQAVVAVNPNPEPLFSRYTNYLGVHCAEAYANQGAFVNYYVKPWGKPHNWDACKAIAGFVVDHQELYAARSIIDTPVAILYLYGEGMRYHTETYLGLAQILAESNIPFDVLFDGDGYYVEESLTLHDLEQYELLLIPSVVDITSTQQQLIKSYVEEGGIALVFNPEELGFDVIQGEQSYGKGRFYFQLENTGAAYFQTYQDNYRDDMEMLVTSYIEREISLSNAHRNIVATPYLQTAEKRVVLHLVNYDRDQWFDSINPKENIAVTIKKPDFSIGQVSVISPDFPERQILDFTDSGDTLHFIVPSLYIYDVIVIESSPSPNMFERPGQGAMYVFNKERTSLPHNLTVLVGPFTIRSTTTFANNTLIKVEFFLDDISMAVDLKPPFEWQWKTAKPGRHSIKIMAQTAGGEQISYERVLWRFL
jgi:hypothetical protein